MPKSSRQSDHTKREANCSDMVMSPVHQVLPKPSRKAQLRRGGVKYKVDKKRGGKTTSGNGQAWSSPSHRAVESREKRRKLVVKSSVVPQRFLWLRDR